MPDDNKEPFELVRAYAISATCLLHGGQYITGSPTGYPLGHGGMYIGMPDVHCTACGAAQYLQMNVTPDTGETEYVSAEDFRAAIFATLQEEMGGGQLEEVNDEDEPAATVVPPPEPVRTAAVLPVFKRPALGG